MIVRVLNLGQFRLEDSEVSQLNEFDDAIEHAVDADDQAALTDALNGMIARVKQLGQPLAVESLEDSDLILPDEEATVADVRSMLDDSGADDGLVPGRS